MGVLTRQAGPNSFMISRDPRLGVVAATLKCYAPDIQTALSAPPLDIGISIPEWNPRVIVENAAGSETGFDVTLSYEGHPDENAASEESFELEGAASDDPIETHWNYEVLLKNYKGKPDANGRAKWPRMLTDDSGKTSRNRMHGVESWPAPGLIWNHNFVSKTLPASLVKMLGTISETVPGNPPELSGGRNWLCIRVRAKQRGNVWQIQMSYQLSGPYGAVPEMFEFVN